MKLGNHDVSNATLYLDHGVLSGTGAAYASCIRRSNQGGRADRTCMFSLEASS